MSTNTIIYHKSDPDGWFSNTVCRKFLPDVQSIGWDYGDPVPELPGEGDIYMVDIAIKELWTDLRLNDRLIWIDHHKTSIAEFDHTGVRGLRIEGVAACRLCWMWFTICKDAGPNERMRAPDWSQRQPGEPEALFLVGLRDVWKHTGTEYEQRCNHLNLALISNRGDERLREDLLMPCEPPDEIVDSLIEKGRAIEHYADSLNAEHSERGAMMREWRGLQWMILNSQARGSKTLEDHAWPIPVDALMVWAVSGKGDVNVSLYHAPNRKDIDLSIIAKEFGGGGHPGACGFRTTLNHIIEILQ